MSQLSELQQYLLDMFDSFHRFCICNHLKYYALGGTLLGAIRHKGFIPWDDDIDIGMPRKDYDIFAQLLSDKMIDDRYLLETPHSADLKYNFPYCKLYDTKTTMIENTSKELTRGIFIDIFPLDGLGSTIDEARENYKLIDQKMKILRLQKVKISADRSFIKNLVLFMVQHLPFKSLSERKLCIDIEELCCRQDFDRCVYGGNLVGAWGFKEVMEREIYGKPVLYQFENIYINGPQNAEKYLSHQYGDWKKLPPKEKQVSHHDYYLDLHKGYLNG